jgi:hypothetical protein
MPLSRWGGGWAPVPPGGGGGGGGGGGRLQFVQATVLTTVDPALTPPNACNICFQVGLAYRELLGPQNLWV